MKPKINLMMCAFFFIIIISSSFFNQFSVEAKKENNAVEEEFIVKLKDAEKTSVHKAGGSPLGEIKKMNILKVKIQKEKEEHFLKEMRKDNNVEWIEPNYLVEIQHQPNDPSWNLQESLRLMMVDKAWDMEFGSPEVIVVVIDTGIDYTHPDISANYLDEGYDWLNNDTDPMDDHGHGTHCAGIIAATIDNNIGIAGISRVKLMSEKFLNSGGSGNVWDAVQAINHASELASNGNKIILSNSWGGYEKSNLLEEAINNAYSKGCLITAAAGNSKTSNPFYPASFENVISVSATDINDNIAHFSNYGEHIELSATGVNILSTYLNNSYRIKSGTSMACPHVSGVASLIWSNFGDYTNGQVRTLLQKSSDDLGMKGYDKLYGYGRINAYKAMTGLAEHDLAVLKIDVERILLIESNTIINVTIKNMGLVSETVEIDIKINNDTVHNEINNIVSSEILEIGFSWKPENTGIHNITAYAVPVSVEEYLENNVLAELIFVNKRFGDTNAQILIVSDDDGNSFIEGTSLNEIALTLSDANYEYDVWSEYLYGNINIDILSSYELVIWTAGDYSEILDETPHTPLHVIDDLDIANIIHYVNDGGNIVIEGQEIARSDREHLKNITHSEYEHMLLSEGLTVVEPEHFVCKNLTPQSDWYTNPPYAYSVTPLDEAKSLMNYILVNKPSNCGALIAYGEGGIGSKSTIFMSYTLKHLEENYREKLVLNSVEWLLMETPLKIKDINSNIIEADENNAYFIYSDTFTDQKPLGCHKADAIDWTATGYVYGLTVNNQLEVLDTDNNVIDQTTGEPKISSTVIFMSGGPIVQVLMKYYENNRIAPVYFKSVNGEYCFYGRNGNKMFETALKPTDSQDMFIVESFHDGKGNKIFAVYGYTGLGTFAGGKYFKEVIVRNIEEYENSYYVYKWLDSDGDHFPETSEISDPIAYG